MMLGKGERTMHLRSALFFAPLSALVLTACTAASTPGEQTPAPTSEGRVETSPSALGTLSTPSTALNAQVDASATITENIENLPQLSTAATLIKAAGIDTTLMGNGPFTVFVPTNAAFNKLAPGTVDGLQQKDQKAQLVRTLTFHAVPGKYLSTDLKDGQKLKTVEGGQLTIASSDGDLTVNGVAVQTADLVVKNGVIHLIDTVLTPGK